MYISLRCVTSILNSFQYKVHITSRGVWIKYKRREGVSGSGVIAPRILDLSARRK